MQERDIVTSKEVCSWAVGSSKVGYQTIQYPMILNIQLIEGKPFEDPERYKWLVGKLNYLIVTCHDNAYFVCVVSQFMLAPTTNHWEVVEHILCYLNGALDHGLLYQGHAHKKMECATSDVWTKSKDDWRSTCGYGVFVGGNIVSWKSKKLSVVSLKRIIRIYGYGIVYEWSNVNTQFVSEINLEVPIFAELFYDN